MKTRHSNNIASATTGFARRALLFFTFFVACVGSVWGQKVIWNEPITGYATISSNLFEGFDYGENTVMRIYTTYAGKLWMMGTINGGSYTVIFKEGAEGVSSNRENIEDNSIYAKTDDTGTYYELPMAKVFISPDVFLQYDMTLQPESSQTITKIEVLNIDSFAGELIGDKDGETIPIAFGLTKKEIDFTRALKKVPNAQYVRIYLEKAGETISNPLGMLKVPNDMQYSEDNKQRGYYVYKPEGITADYLNVTLELIAAELDNYQVVTVWSTRTAESLPEKEPDWDLQYTFSFEYPFKAETVEETVTKELPVGPKDWEQNLKVAFDYVAKKIKLLGQNGTELSALDIEESVWDEISTTSPASFYVRWFLQDAVTGEEQYNVVDALIDGTGVYEIPEKERYGLYWSSSRKSASNLSEIMQMSVDGTKIDLSAYNLVCTIATTLDGIAPTDNSKALSHEPNTIALEYIFKFVDADWTGIENPQWTHVREVFVSNNIATTSKVTIPLAESYTRILTEYRKMGKELGESFHMRWYVTYNDELVNSQNYLTPNGSQGYDNSVKWGWYWNSKTCGITNPLADEPSDASTIVSNLFNVDFTKPAEGYWSDYKVVVVMSDDLEDQSYTSSWDELAHEPSNLNMKYIFRFYTEDEFQLVHYKGEANRPYVTPDTDSRIKSQVQQYSWDRELGEPVQANGDIRQGVHTVELEVYMNPDETDCVLPVPMQDYYKFATNESGSGNALEPAAYFRWYDWATDMHSEKLTSKGNLLKEKTDAQGHRGLFMLNRYKESLNPTHERMGVTYNPSGLTTNDVVDYIACDVSKYFDGIYDGSDNDDRNEIGGKVPVMLHEPTISMRYIFTIRPASVIMNKILGSVDEQRGSAYFKKVKEDLQSGTTYNTTIKGKMFNLCEDRGRVIVSDGSSFSVRTALPTFGDYYISGQTKCTKVTWYAYYESAEGLWYNSTPLYSGDTSSDGRITTFTLGNLGGNYTLLSSNSKTESLSFSEWTTLTPTIHIIGCIGDGTNQEEAIHYELQFINQPAVSATEIQKKVSDLKADAESKKILYDKAKTDYEALEGKYDYYIEEAYKNATKNYDNALEAYKNMAKRTKTYLEDNYDSQGCVDFNNYFADFSEPTNQFENMTFEPFEWEEAQYSFCYPNIDRFRIGTQGNSGLTPIHGDYMVLKSINKPNVSKNDTKPYSLHFYEYEGEGELDDYTYTLGKKDWGGFIYVDASDETRTIAGFDFDADLCHGSHIYFTAAVADVTTGTPPQIMAKVYGVKENGEEVLVISFLSGVLSMTKAQWYQVYGEGTIPEYIDMTGIKSYKVEIVNFAKNTLGADYCVDDICFYTSTAKVLLTHAGSSNCDDGEENGEIVLAYMEAEGLQNAFGVLDGPQPIYWRICEEGSKVPITGVGMYPQYKLVNGSIEWDNDDTDETIRNTYGITYMISDYNAEGVVVTEYPNTPETYGWYKDEDGKFFFQIANKTFDALEKGKHYYVSVYIPGVDIKESYEESYWGSADDPCSIYSEFFIPRRQYVTFISPTSGDGEEGGDITIACGSTEGAKVSGVVMVLKVPDETEITGFKDEQIAFDYLLLSKDDWNTTTNIGKEIEYTYAQLVAALKNYRENYKDTEGLNSEYKTKNEPNYNILDDAVNKAKILILAASDKFKYIFDQVGTYHVTCIPVEDDINGTTICGPFEVVFTLTQSGGPSLTLGFEGVNYDGHGNMRVVRVGKEQLEKMQNIGEGKGFFLHIPVNKFKTSDDAPENTGALTIVSKSLELLKYDAAKVADDTWTNDPKVGDENVYVATFDGQEISANRKYISLKFHDANGANVTKQDFKEGFTYRMFFQVKDAVKVDDNNACEAGVEFLMKVVPEYVTWNDEATTGDGAVTPNTNVSANWNNDKNWSRSRKAELHKTETNSDGYQNNGTGEGDNGVASTPATFVPMKFTYVTIPSGNRAPVLEELTIGSEGIYTATSMGYGATPNIQYDLMVMVDEENKCEHGGGSSVYDCEKFYGNWAKEIYFKPRAELVHQQYLTYEKAWVEKELVANKWYLMSTPLKETYAGDMYVPYSETDGKNGRQETEAFKAINFTDAASGGIYSRTAYPIYQRSWGMKDGTVYTQVADIYRSYSANLGYTTWSGNIAEWGHTFNDVDVPYTTRSGFSIRAHKKDQTAKALIRLPKDDTSYSYYGYDTGKGEYTEQGAAKSSFEKDADYIGQFLTTSDNADITLKLDNTQQMGGYVLVGNPYMASLDMEAFFDEKANPGLVQSYYTYRYDEDKKEYEIGVYSETKGFGIIRPLESFFVKNKGTATEIKFTADMMIDGNTYQKTAPSRMFALTASNGRGQSSATVSVGEEAKSVETLFDSNLSDVPMVYTVADGQAVSINQVTELSRPIAFGVTCTASSEPVTVAFSDIAQLTSGEVYVVDAVTGEQTLVTEGSTLSVQPNDYGRYFLLAGTMGISDKADVQKGIVVSVRGKEVTVTSVEALTLVRAFSPSGATVYQNTMGGTSKSFVLGSGVYIVQAENAGGEQQTAKVVLKNE